MGDTLLYHPPTQTWLFQMNMMCQGGLSNMAAATASTSATTGDTALSVGGSRGGGSPEVNWNDRFFKTAWAAREPAVISAGGTPIELKRFSWVAVSVEGTDYTYAFGGASGSGTRHDEHGRYAYTTDSWLFRRRMAQELAEHRTAHGLQV
jgi:hypothetical protein